MDADDIALGNGKVLGKAAGAVHAHALRVRAEVEETLAAVAAVTAHDVTLAGYHVARLVLGHGRAHALDDAAELMPHVHTHGDGLLGPGIPVPDVQVRAADCGFVNLDENIICTDFGHRHIHQLQAGSGYTFDEGFHFGAKLYSRPVFQASQISVCDIERSAILTHPQPRSRVCSGKS